MRFSSLSEAFLLAAIAFLPFTVRTLLLDSSAYATGNFVEMSALFLSLSDALLAASFFGFALTDTKKWPIRPVVFVPILGFLSLALSPVFWAADSLLVAGRWLHLALWTIAAVVIAVRIDREKVATVVLVSALVQGVLAIAQFFSGGSIGLHFLGEQIFSASTLGAAKFWVENTLWVRPYGSFVHPNLLAFFLGIAFFVGKNSKFSVWRWALLLPLFLTFSRAAIGAVFLGILFEAVRSRFSWSISKKWFIGAIFTIAIVVVPLWKPINARLDLESAFAQRISTDRFGIALALQNPFGVGMGNGISALTAAEKSIKKPWEIEPPHAAPIAMAVEIGVVAAIAVFALEIWFFATSGQVGLALLFFAVALTDHFLWDLQTGLALAAICLGWVGKNASVSVERSTIPPTVGRSSAELH